MLKQQAAQTGTFLRQGVRELPGNAAWVWERARALVVVGRSRAAGWIAQRPGRSVAADTDGMTKNDLMELARKEQIKEIGRAHV